MRISIKNAEMAYVDLNSVPHRLVVDVNGADFDDLLVHIDIIKAIDYYGITELLDTIGEGRLKSHLECLL